MTYVLFNDQIIERSNVKIDMEDRGYNFGDGVYEVMPIYNGHIFTIDEHLKRFEESASKLEIQLPYSLTEASMLLHKLKEKNNITEGILYIQMTRGVQPRAHLYSANGKGLITGFSREVSFPKDQQKNGIHTYLTDDIRWLRCDIKSINLLGSTMAKRLAANNNCHEAILHRNGLITEGSSSNFFIVKNNILYTHPATNLILNGITRQLVLKLAKENGYSIKEKAIEVEELKDCDEAFITSTTQEITPIIQINGDSNISLSIGNVTTSLQKLFREYVNKLCNR